MLENAEIIYFTLLYANIATQCRTNRVKRILPVTHLKYISFENCDTKIMRKKFYETQQDPTKILSYIE